MTTRPSMALIPRGSAGTGGKGAHVLTKERSHAILQRGTRDDEMGETGKIMNPTGRGETKHKVLYSEWTASMMDPVGFFSRIVAKRIVNT